MSSNGLRYEHHGRVMRILAEHDPGSYMILATLERHGAYDDLVEVIMSNLECGAKAADHIIKQAQRAYWMVYDILVG
jgi:hypothetical protein